MAHDGRERAEQHARRGAFRHQAGEQHKREQRGHECVEAGVQAGEHAARRVVPVQKQQRAEREQRRRGADAAGGFKMRFQRAGDRFQGSSLL